MKKPSVTFDRDSSGLQKLERWIDADTEAGGLYSHLGIRVLACDEGSDVEVDLQAFHKNFVGSMHGGVVATLIDCAASVCVLQELNAGESFSTAQLNVQFIAALRGEGKVHAKGRLTKRGKKLAFADAELTDAEGRLCAKGSAVFYIVSR